VNAEHLRFDFSHFAKLTDQELEQIERMVNEKIRENIPVLIREMPRDEAMKTGAMALFGEKYGDVVRVVIIDPAFSIELCGGTHVSTSGELGFFKIKSESAVAAGVRRIEDVDDEFKILNKIRDQFKNPKELLKSVQELQTETGNLRKRIESMEMKQAGLLRIELLKASISLGNYKFIGKIIESISPDSLRKLASDLRQDSPDLMVILATVSDERPQVVIGLGDLLISEKKLDASKIIKEIVAPLIKGGGGGQKNLATAGGQDAGDLGSVINSVKALIV
jgi:alanyl-tRNA synthetase